MRAHQSACSEGLRGLVVVACASWLGLAAAGCGGTAASPPAAGGSASAGAAGKRAATWSLTSKAFRNNQAIPAKHTADGRDVSPDLSWSAPPKGTTEFALVCDDPDAPRGVWTHWVLYGLPAAQRGLPEAVPTTETLPKLGGAKQGRNSFGSIGYRGPAPPPGAVHHYRFRLYALNAPVTLRAGAQQAELERAMKGHVLARAELVGLYSR